MKQTWWEASHTEVTCFVVLLCNINHAKKKLDTKYLSRDKVCLCPTRFLARKKLSTASANCIERICLIKCEALVCLGWWHSVLSLLTAYVCVKTIYLPGTMGECVGQISLL